MSDVARRALEIALGYTFRDPDLLLRALTHRSFANERGSSVGHNERLEFLGDSVLNLCVSHELVRRFPAHSEGVLSRLRASVVSAPALAELAKTLGLGACLRLGRGEEQTGGREKPSLLADAYEALLAALYLDGGMEQAFAAVRAQFAVHFEAMAHGPAETFDAKTRLQERVQAHRRVTPRYRVVATSGPEHEKIFESEILVDGEVLARGSGRNKKEAEQRAAHAALLRLESDEALAAGGLPESVAAPAAPPADGAPSGRVLD